MAINSTFPLLTYSMSEVFDYLMEADNASNGMEFVTNDQVTYWLLRLQAEARERGLSVITPAPMDTFEGGETAIIIPL